jgi:hypothetical protein
MAAKVSFLGKTLLSEMVLVSKQLLLASDDYHS